MNSKLVKYFVILIAVFSILSGVGGVLFPAFFNHIPFFHLIGLSLWGIEHFFYWQFFTHLFFYPAFQGLDAGFLIALFLNTFFLLRLGSTIVFQKGTRHFLILFLGSGLISGLTAFYVLTHLHSPLLFAGTTPAIFTLLIATLVLFPETQLMFLLAIPIKAKWVVLAMLSSILLIDLSHGTFLSFFTNLSAILFGYLYAISVWQKHGPFQALRKVDSFFINAFSIFFPWTQKKSLDAYATTKSKIYDFKTGNRILNDDDFLDACLSKIANEGRSSLNWHEKLRLWQISKKRASLR
jgi:membrane associated rhomboid family serine protease